MITLHFDKLYSKPRNNEPCMIAIPFKKGLLQDTEELCFFQKSRKLPMQVKVTARHKDGSVKYVFVRFLADIPANKGTKVFCTVTKEEAEKYKNDNHVIFEEIQKITCSETQNGFQIDTGALQFSLARNTGTLFESLTFQDKSYAQDSFPGPKLTLENGQCYEIGYHDWCILEKGEVSYTLSNKAVLKDKDSVLPCEIRVTAYAGKSFLDISVRLTNACKEALTISSYTFSYQASEESKRATVATSNYRTQYQVSEDGTPVRQDITAEMLFYQNNEHFGEVFAGTLFADSTNSTGGVCGTIYQALQNFPKAVEADAKGFTLMLVPQGDTKVVMQPGMAREQRFQLFFHEADMELSDINHRSAVYQMPDKPYMDSTVYEESGLFPNIFVHEKQFDAECALIAAGDGHARCYGMMNWGDAPDMNYTNQGRGKGKLVWTNNEYDFPHACMLMYFKSGLRRFLDYALVAGNHQIDVDVCHVSDDPLLLGGQWEHTQGHVVNGDMVCSHQWVEGILDCYHATGDERYLETAVGIGENILRLLDTPMYQQEASFNARETGWALRTLTALYTETYDEKWTVKSDWIVDQFQSWAYHFGGWLAPYTDNTAIRVPFMISVAVGSLARYYREFPSEKIKNMILLAVDDMIENCMLENGLFYYKELPSLNRMGNNPLVLEALAIAYELTKKKKYLQAGFATYHLTVERFCQSSGGGGRRIVEDTVLLGTTGTKTFAQGFIPLATYYKALEEAHLF